ncbi:MAG: hypothetical protein ACK56I_30865, partial [bacterium]
MRGEQIVQGALAERLLAEAAEGLLVGVHQGVDAFQRMPDGVVAELVVEALEIQQGDPLEGPRRLEAELGRGPAGGGPQGIHQPHLAQSVEALVEDLA